MITHAGINLRQPFVAARRHRGTWRGFTLIELLVVIAIMSILIVAINRVFLAASKTVAIGTALSKVTQTSRAIDDQIQRDFEHILLPDTLAGPSSSSPGPAFLMIVNQRYPAMHILPEDADTGTQRTVRSDQVLFFRSVTATDPLHPRTPQDPNTFTNLWRSPMTAARVWYGHGLRTRPDGFDDDTDPNGPGLGFGLNRCAGQWILARQAMLMDSALPLAGTVYAEDRDAITSVSGKEYYLVTADTPVLGGLTNDPDEPGQNGIPATVYMGLCDVAWSYEINMPMPSKGWEALFGTNGFFAQVQATSVDDYRTMAYRMAYVTGDNSGMPLRLRVNPMPVSRTLEGWQVAQMHPNFAANVSDFIVEFAGDLTSMRGRRALPDGRIDVGGDGDIQWYAAGGFAVQDMAVMEAPTWYDKVHDPDPNDTISNADSEVSDQAQFPANYDANDIGAFVWEHNTVISQAEWPYLIRIRYRLHDDRGHLVGADGEPGRWHEVIVRVR